MVVTERRQGCAVGNTRVGKVLVLLEPIAEDTLGSRAMEQMLMFNVIGLSGLITIVMQRYV